jgi:hypothetical protein
MRQAMILSVESDELWMTIVTYGSMSFAKHQLFLPCLHSAKRAEASSIWALVPTIRYSQSETLLGSRVGYWTSCWKQSWYHASQPCFQHEVHEPAHLCPDPGCKVGYDTKSPFRKERISEKGRVTHLMTLSPWHWWSYPERKKNKNKSMGQLPIIPACSRGYSAQGFSWSP